MGVETLHITRRAARERTATTNPSMARCATNCSMASVLHSGQSSHPDRSLETPLTARPHSSLGYRPSAPETATLPWPPSGSVTLHLRPTMAPKATMPYQSTMPLGGVVKVSLTCLQSRSGSLPREGSRSRPNGYYLRILPSKPFLTSSIHWRTSCSLHRATKGESL